MRKERGFSLIELLIVVAIILIIAAIAIPNLMRARMAANDSSAAASIHAINVGEVAYFDTYPNVGFPATLSVLEAWYAPCPPQLASSITIWLRMAGETVRAATASPLLDRPAPELCSTISFIPPAHHSAP